MSQQIKSENIKKEDKIRLGDRWWIVTSINKNLEDIILTVESKFVGECKVTIPAGVMIEIDKDKSLGHKGQHLWTNDSSTEKKKSFVPYRVVEDSWGKGSG